MGAGPPPTTSTGDQLPCVRRGRSPVHRSASTPKGTVLDTRRTPAPPGAGTTPPTGTLAALVLDGHTRAGLAAIRALGSAGRSVGVADYADAPPSCGAASRWC